MNSSLSLSIRLAQETLEAALMALEAGNREQALRLLQTVHQAIESAEINLQNEILSQDRDA